MPKILSNTNKSFYNTGINTIITSKTRRQLLFYLFHKQQQPEPIRQISRKSGVNINSTVKEINQLIRAKILNFKIKGNTKVVWANQEHPLYYSLYSCLYKSYGLGALLLKNFQKEENIEFLIITHFLLESLPKDKYDFDILFIINQGLDMQRIMNIMQDIELSVNQSLVFTALKKQEFINRIKLFDTFVWKVFKNKHIFIKGNFFEIFV